MTKVSHVAGSKIASPEVIIEVVLMANQKSQTCVDVAQELLKRGFGKENEETGEMEAFQDKTVRSRIKTVNKKLEEQEKALREKAKAEGKEDWESISLPRLPELKLNNESTGSRGSKGYDEETVGSWVDMISGFSPLNGETEQGNEVDSSKFFNQPKS